MSKSCHEFLDEFCSELSVELSADNDSIPFDIVRGVLTAEEIEGQCIDWVLTFLSKRGCSSYLAAVITQETVQNVLRTLKENVDLHSYKNEADQQKARGSMPSDQLRQITYKEVVSTCHALNRQALCAFDRIRDPETSVHAIKNTRRKMEDRHVLLPHFGRLFKIPKSRISYYAVFDGHGGVDAAQFAATHLHCILARYLHNGNSITDALKQSFADTDNLFVDLANRERMTSGSTAVCAVVDGDTLHIAWLGDSQALLVRDGQPVQLMIPHKPEREDEKKRIEDLGGCILYIGTWRVNGTLSVSRAIGDVTSKPFISGEPDVASLSYKPGDWLILACDGLWDQLTYDDAAAVISDGDKSSIAHRLIKMAKERGSGDNITVVCVCLGFQSDVTDSDQIIFLSGSAADDHKEPDRKPRQDDSRRDNNDRNSEAGQFDVSRDLINSSTESSRLSLSVKRSAECSDDEKNDLQPSKDSEQNVFDMSKLTCMNDVSAHSDVSSSWTTTSDDASRKSADTSSETGLSGIDSRMMQIRRRSRRRSSQGGLMPMKENRWPSDGAVGTTPPCVQHVSPPPFDDTVLHSQPSFHKSCRSLSWVSTGPLHAMAQRAGASTGCTVRSPVETRCRTPAYGTPSSRWTIAVEVDADLGMFDSSFPDMTAKIPAMNMSSHW